MPILKVDVINDAYSRMRVSGLTVDPSPEDVNVAIDRLENMASSWASRDINAGYNFEEDPYPNTDSGITRAMKQAFAANLGVLLCPDFGKPVPPGLEREATGTLSTLSGSLFTPGRNHYPHRQGIGSGNLRCGLWWRRFYPRQVEPGIQTEYTRQDMDGRENYTVDWVGWLNGEDLGTSEWFQEEGNGAVIEDGAFSEGWTSMFLSFSDNVRGKTYALTNRVTSATTGRSNDFTMFVTST